MSLENENGGGGDGNRRRRGLFRRSNKQNSSHQSSVNDDLDSLGMGSNSGERPNKPQRGRFRIRRSKDDSEIDLPRPQVITTRARARSNDEVSFDGSSIRDESNRNENNEKTNEAPSSGKSEPRLWRRLNPLSKGRKLNSKESASEAESEKSSSVHPHSLQYTDSFDSDNMLNHVRSVKPTIRYSRKYLSPDQGGRSGDPILADGGFTIHTEKSNQDVESMEQSEAPIKRISFDESIGSPLIDQEIPTRPGTTFASQASVQTYRSMGATETFSERARYTGREGNRANRKKFRVRPYQCFHDTVHMTEEEIYNDSVKPSLTFERLKSYLAPSSNSHAKCHVTEDIRQKYGSPKEDGRIGSLRCEVLGCVSLARKSKPDVCVYLIAGDVAFCTDVIQGYRSPMWPSVCRRAAVFPLHHAYTRLYAGVFDVRARKNKENDVFCGRVSIDIASLRPNTEYDITFPLRASAFVYDKQKRGVLRLRFSLHWFTERGAVLSYFYSPRSLDPSAPLVQGSPTIPCADPKTFRNVAVTIHGSDLPGKYSRLAFKATVREFQLYQLNIRYMLKYLVIDAIFYEKPYISLYLFFAGMHCVITESVSKVPPYLMGFVIILYLENYKHYVADTLYNEGYQPLTFLEVFKALVSKTGSDEKYFEPILVTKRAKKRNRRNNSRTIRRIQADSPAPSLGNDDAENVLLDHKEFPFSDREAYPKFTVEHALAPSSRRGSNTRLHGRLSVYYAPADSDQGGGDDSGEEEDDESSDDSAGDETIIEGAGIYDSAFDLDDGDDDDIPGPGRGGSSQRYEGATVYGYGTGGPGTDTQGEKGKIRRIVHSAQNIDDAGGAAVPPQVTVKRVENLFHKNSYSLAVEKVVAPPTKEHVQLALNKGNDHGHEKLALTTEEIEKEIEKMRKAYLDEFDKLLGLQSKSSNPISRMFATFLGPLMRILRIPVFMFRILFNASTWRDPFLSFWLFCFMCLALIILMAFPWRLFFLLVTVIGLGPQNIFLRKYIEKWAEKRKADEAKSKEDNDIAASESAYNPNAATLDHPSAVRRQRTDDSDNMSVRSERRGLFGRKKNRGKFQGPGEGSDFIVAQDRPPFSSDIHATNNRKLQPRSVVVPYSRLRKERFYDWPPDPTVSRATPLEFEMWSMDHYEEDVMMEKSGDEHPIPFERRLSTGHHTPPVRGLTSAESLRRRRGSM
ncbi:hypothetical protein ACA910_012880 [Epithemia clementina (nom. ined.)]